MSRLTNWILSAVGSAVFFMAACVNAQWAQTGPCGGSVAGFAISGNTLYAAACGGVYVSTDFGIDWTHSNWGLREGDIRAVAATSSKLFAGTWGDGVYYRDINGLIWQQTSLTDEDIYCLAVVGTNIFAGTYEDGVFRSTDNGATWTPVNNGLGNDQVESFAVTSTTLFAGTNDSVYVTTDNGNDWTAASSGLPDGDVLSLAFNGSNLYAGLWDSAPYTSPNNGDGWLQFGGDFPGRPYIRPSLSLDQKSLLVQTADYL